MQVWRFYLIKEKTSGLSQWQQTNLETSVVISNEPVGKHYPLYAITNRKKLAKAFMKERDMNKFIVNTSEVNTETWSDFANENNGKLINYHQLSTGSDVPDEDGLFTKKVTVLLTEAEFILCGSMHDDDEVLSTLFGSLFDEYDMITPMIFTDQARKHLSRLKYPAIFVLESSDENYDAWDRSLWEEGNDLYYYHDNLGSVMKITVDELKYFISNYGELFR